MMQCEFEKLYGAPVDPDVYYNVIEPMYYASDLPKKEFVKTLNRKKYRAKRRLHPVFISDGKHYPDSRRFLGGWYMLLYQNTNIGTGVSKFIVRPSRTGELTDKNGWDLILSDKIDIDTSNCLNQVHFVR